MAFLLIERNRQRAAQKKLDERLCFAEWVSSLSATLIHLPVQQIDDQIVDALRKVTQWLGFDFAALTIFTESAQTQVTYAWQVPGTPPMPFDLTATDLPWITQQCLSGKDVSFLSPKELPPEAAIDRSTHEKIQVRSSHCVPLRSGQIPVGVLKMGTFNREQGIPAEWLRRQRLLGEIFANALARKRAEESLRASEEHIQLAAQSAHLGLWNWDVANDSIWATKNCRELCGVGPEQEISFQTFLDTFHDGDRARVSQAIERSLIERGDFAEECRAVLPDGTVRWIEIFGRGNYDSTDMPMRIFGVLMDITERKGNEASLMEERDFLRQVINVDPNFLFAKDREGRFTLANRAVADAYGTTVENLLGKSDADFNPNIEEVEFFRRLDQEVIDTNQERFISEEQITDAKGNLRWLQTVKRPIIGSQGRTSQVLGSSTDITEHKRAEKRFRLAVEASPNAIIMADSLGQILLVNVQTEKLLGYSREELIGQSIEMLVPERYRGGHPQHRAGFFAAPQARSMGGGRVLFARRKDGSERMVEIGLNPIDTAEGTVVLTAIVDITDVKRAETEMQRQRDELAHFTRVSMMGELAASLAHELNQPLTAILSNAQAAQRFLMAKPANLNEVREILKDIVDDNSRAGEIIRRMRALVRKEDFAFARLDLSAVVGDVVALVHSDAILRNVQVHYHVGADLPPVRGDRIQLQQVALNLFLNAFDALRGCRSDERKLWVSVDSDGNSLVELSVRDCGTGLTSDKLDTIFEPFYTTKKDGLGMGLSISRSIVEAHGGRMWAENNDDQDRGATFHVTLLVCNETDSIPGSPA